MEMVSQSGSGENFEGVIRIEEGKIRSHVDQVVRETVEQTLNGLLQAEADELCGAKRYARSPERLDTRAGHYDRQLHTQAGEVTLSVPRLRNLPFETEIIERYRRREIERRRGLGRDVPGRRVGAACGGHHRSPVGHAGQPQHGQRAEPEDLRADRCLAQPADRGRACLRVLGRHLAQALAGAAR